MVYGLILNAGAPLAFWPVVLAASRAHGLGRRADAARARARRAAAGCCSASIAALSVLTTLPWLTAILLTDIFCGLGVLALYLLLLRDEHARPRRAHRPDRADRGRRRHPQRDPRRAAGAADRRRVVCASSAASALPLAASRPRRARAGARLRRWCSPPTLPWPSGSPGRRAASRCRSAACCRTASSRNISTSIAPTRPASSAPTRTQLPRRRRRLVLGQPAVRQARPLRRPRQEMENIALGSLIDYPGAADRNRRHRHRAATDRRAHRRRRAQHDLAHLWHHPSATRRSLCRPCRRRASSTARSSFRRHQPAALSGRAGCDGAAAADRAARLARRTCPPTSANSPPPCALALLGQRLRLRRAVQPARPLWRAHGLARRPLPLFWPSPAKLRARSKAKSRRVRRLPICLGLPELA